MKKNFIFLSVFICIVIISFASAGWFSDLRSKIAGNSIDSPPQIPAVGLYMEGPNELNVNHQGDWLVKVYCTYANSCSSRYIIDWGDSTKEDGISQSSNPVNVHHTYDSPGTYNILIYYKDAKQTTTSVKVVGTSNNLPSKPPQVPAAALHINGSTILDVNQIGKWSITAFAFYESNSYLDYIIDWGDSTNESNRMYNFKEVSHSYKSPGFYNIIIYAKDKNGRVARSATTSVKVKKSNPVKVKKNSWSYCSSLNKCLAGEGDCDRDSDCITGYCNFNVGKNYGVSRFMDFCECRVGTKWNGSACIIPDTNKTKKKIINPNDTNVTYQGILKMLQNNCTIVNPAGEGLNRITTGKEVCRDYNKKYDKETYCIFAESVIGDNSSIITESLSCNSKLDLSKWAHVLCCSSPN